MSDEHGDDVSPAHPNPAGFPVEHTDMVNRAREVRSLVDHLSAPGDGVVPTLVAVHGPGGFGKTTVAAHVMQHPRVRARFDETLWVETGEGCTPARVLQLISDLCVRLGGTRPALADPEQAGFYLARVLGERQVMLVIDNVWSAADLAPFLLDAPRCARLVTTRNLRVCPARARIVHLGPLAPDEIAEMLHRSLHDVGRPDTVDLAVLCGGWPLLAAVVGATVSQDVATGSAVSRALADAEESLRTVGAVAYDVWDSDQRRHAIGQAITSSLRNLGDRVLLSGGVTLEEKYLSLAVFPPSTAIPLSVLEIWWHHTDGWRRDVVRQFCRILSDRSLVETFMAGPGVLLVHDVFRSHLRDLVGDGWSGRHRSLLDAFRPVSRAWADLDDHAYVWRYLPFHLFEAGLVDEALSTVGDADYIVAKVARLGHQSLALDREVTDQLGELVAGDVTVVEDWRAADLLTGNAFLLHGMSAPGDVAASLLTAAVRADPGSFTTEALRDLVAQAPLAFDVAWVGGAGEPGTDEETADQHVGTLCAVATWSDVIATCGEDGVVRVRDGDARAVRHVLRGHTGLLHAVAISAVGVVASAGDDGAIRLWDLSSGRPRAALRGHTKRVRGLAFTAAGDRLVSGSEDGRVCVWDVAGSGLVGTIAHTGTPVWTVAVGCGDRFVAVGGEDPFVRVYALGTGNLVDETIGHDDWVRSVSFARDADVLASGSGDGTVRVWNVDDGRLTTATRLTADGARVRSVVLSADGGVAFFSTEDGRVVRWSTTDGYRQRRMPPDVDWVRGIATTRSGGIVAACEDGAVRLWTGAEDATVVELSRGRNTVWSTAVDDHLGVTLLGGADGTIEVVDPVTGRHERRVAAGRGRVWSLGAEAGRMAAACGDGLVRLWTEVDGPPVVLATDGLRAWSVAVCRAGTRLAAGAGQGGIWVWDLPRGGLLWRFAGHTGRVRSLALDADGELLVTGGGDGATRVWSVRHRDRVAEFRTPGEWVRAVAIDLRGRVVAAGTGTGDVNVWRLSDGRHWRLSGHAGRVLAIELLADSRLVSVASDGSVRLWSVPTETQLAEIRTDSSYQCASVDPIGARVITSSATGVVAIALPPTGESTGGVPDPAR